MDKRTLLAIALSIAVMLLYQTFFAKPPAPLASSTGSAFAQPDRASNAPNTPA